MKMNERILHLAARGRVPVSLVSQEIKADLPDRNCIELAGIDPLAANVPFFTANVDWGCAGESI